MSEATLLTLYAKADECRTTVSIVSSQVSGLTIEMVLGSQSNLLLPSFQGFALERTAFEAPPRVSHAFPTQEAGASGALRPQAEPGDE